VLLDDLKRRRLKILRMLSNASGAVGSTVGDCAEDLVAIQLFAYPPQSVYHKL